MNIDPRVDHYETLGVKPDATPEEIKKAYRRLAKRYHPDKTGGDKAKEHRFKEVSEAYDVLGNAETRQQYDAMRSGGFGAGGFSGAEGFSGGFGAEGFSGGFGGGPGFGSMGGGLGDLFAQMFSGGVGGNGGQNVRYSFYTDDGVPHDTSGFAGQQRRRAPRRQSTSPRERKVRASNGSWLVQRGSDVYSDVRVGVGEAMLGTVKQVATLTGMASVKIPPGTSSGVKLRLKGRGADGKGQQGRGNHYVTVHIDVPKELDDESKKLLVKLMRRIKKKTRS